MGWCRFRRIFASTSAHRPSAFPFAELERACAAMSAHYRGRERTSSLALSPQAKTAAYLVTRLPATYVAAHAVLSELKQRLGNVAIKSLLDLGAGPGAATLAARSLFPALAATLVESDRRRSPPSRGNCSLGPRSSPRTSARRVTTGRTIWCRELLSRRAIASSQAACGGPRVAGGAPRSGAHRAGEPGGFRGGARDSRPPAGEGRPYGRSLPRGRPVPHRSRPTGAISPRAWSGLPCSAA